MLYRNSSIALTLLITTLLEDTSQRNLQVQGHYIIETAFWTKLSLSMERAYCRAFLYPLNCGSTEEDIKSLDLPRISCHSYQLFA